MFVLSAVSLIEPLVAATSPHAFLAASTDRGPLSDEDFRPRLKIPAVAIPLYRIIPKAVPCQVIVINILNRMCIPNRQCDMSTATM